MLSYTFPLSLSLSLFLFLSPVSISPIPSIAPSDNISAIPTNGTDNNNNIALSIGLAVTAAIVGIGIVVIIASLGVGIFMIHRRCLKKPHASVALSMNDLISE